MSGLILVVEDDERTLKLIRDILEAIDYKVIAAIDGIEAVEKANTEKPDLITMDIQLPGISGIDATRMIKANPATAKIPIIAITASAMSGQDQAALQAGCISHITKPFDIDFLIGKIDEYLPQKETPNHV